jgi:predicted chitinase
MKKAAFIVLFYFLFVKSTGAGMIQPPELLKYLIMTVNEIIVKNELTAAGFTPEAAAAVMGVVGGESAFTTLKEASYKNTDNVRIRAIFPVRLGSASDTYLNQIKQSDEAFFNAVYGGMYGNAPNEGFKYVGRGFNGITFKNNYIAAAQGTGLDLVNRPELLENPANAAKALAFYFRSVKEINDLEKAFQEAYRQNAGPGRTWEYYNSSPNPVHKEGIPRKRAKAQYYYDGNLKKKLS